SMLSYMPIQASAHAAEIDQMTILVHWLIAVLFDGWGAFFIYVVFRYRSGANPKASYEGAKGKISKGLEIGVVIAEMVLLVFYALPSWAKRLYEMRVKQDAIPGMSIPVWFIPTRIGEYDIACSQLCGLGHFRMRGFLSIQSDADYRKWMDDELKGLQPAR